MQVQTFVVSLTVCSSFKHTSGPRTWPRFSRSKSLKKSPHPPQFVILHLKSFSISTPLLQNLKSLTALCFSPPTLQVQEASSEILALGQQPAGPQVRVGDWAISPRGIPADTFSEGPQECLHSRDCCIHFHP